MVSWKYKQELFKPHIGKNSGKEYIYSLRFFLIIAWVVRSSQTMCHICGYIRLIVYIFCWINTHCTISGINRDVGRKVNSGSWELNEFSVLKFFPAYISSNITQKDLLWNNTEKPKQITRVTSCSRTTVCRKQRGHCECDSNNKEPGRVQDGGIGNSTHLLPQTQEIYNHVQNNFTWKKT